MREPSWWESLTPVGQTVVAILALIVFVLLMIVVGTIQTWGP